MDYKFYRKEEEKWEKVELVLWIWEATYNDNSTLRQYDEAGIFHQIKEIDQSKLKTFSVENIETHQRVSMSIPSGKKLYHKYENAVLNYGTDEEQKLRAFIFGYEANYCVITFDNDIIFTDDYNKVDIFEGKII